MLGSTDEFCASVRAARALPPARLLARGTLRDQVEAAQALVVRRDEASQKRARLLADRAAVHRDDLAAAEAAAVSGSSATPKLPEHDQQLVAVVRELAGLGREIAHAVDAIDVLRPTEGRAASASAVKRSEKINDRAVELRAELDDLAAEAAALERTVSWAASRAPGERIGVPAVKIGDLRSQDRAAAQAAAN